jgi:hypothetical protein
MSCPPVTVIPRHFPKFLQNIKPQTKRPVTIPWYGRVSEGCSDFEEEKEEEEEERAKDGRRDGQLKARPSR